MFGSDGCKVGRIYEMFIEGVSYFFIGGDGVDIEIF